MGLRRRRIKDDLLILKWWLAALLVSIAFCTGAYLLSASTLNQIQRNEFNALSNLDLIRGQVREIEEAEQIVVDNIDLFNDIAAGTVMEEENRVALLEEIRQIRETHQLYPITVQIEEQDRIFLPYASNIEAPVEQISLRSSIIRVGMPLLHEQDLDRFLADFLASGRLLVTSHCNIQAMTISAEQRMEVIPHQIADCEFYWYTLRREPYTGA